VGHIAQQRIDQPPRVARQIVRKKFSADQSLG
jgi:hypothetical protein